MFKAEYFLLLFLLFPFNLISLDLQQDIIEKGSELVGTPYRYGGTDPSGFDCSGLVNYLYKPYIPSLPRTSSGLSTFGSTITESELKAGDLVFYATGQNREEITHVGIYIGQNTLIQAVSSGPEKGVILTDINEKYWKNRYKWAKRFFTPDPELKLSKIDLNFNKGSYSGTAKNSEPEGNGRMVLANGDIYEGQFLDGLFHGTGEYHYKNGDIYIGEFENGRESGGQIIRPNGNRYNAERNLNGTLIIDHFEDRGKDRTNYLIEPARGWDDWLNQEMERFDASISAEKNALQAESLRFEEWKKNN